MSHVIEFRSGSFLQLEATSGPLETAMRFGSAEEADQFMKERQWIVFNGGMVMPEPASAHQRELERAWQQGWDERERRGALAGAFERGPEFNPYRVGPPPKTWFNTKKSTAPALKAEQREQRLVELDRVISTAPLRMRETLQSIWFLVQQVEPAVALPTLGFDEDGGAHFGWNPGDRSLDIAIHLASDGTYSIGWFYASHVTSEQDTDAKSPHLHGYLQYVRLFSA
jgi:hypothetical protein